MKKEEQKRRESRSDTILTDLRQINTKQCKQTKIPILSAIRDRLLYCKISL